MMARASMVGFRPMVVAERFTRSQCRSRSGITPSNTRAPSNTDEPSQDACERGPMIGGLPSCHAPSNQFQVCEYQATRLSLSVGVVAPIERPPAPGVNGFPAPGPLILLISFVRKCDWSADGAVASVGRNGPAPAYGGGQVRSLLREG